MYPLAMTEQGYEPRVTLADLMKMVAFVDGVSKTTESLKQFGLCRCCQYASTATPARFPRVWTYP